MRLLVTGASGLLGLNLSLAASTAGHQVTGLVHTRPLVGVPFFTRQVNLLDGTAALDCIESAKPDAIIHCAAVANLDAAEKSPELAQHLNAEIPGILAEAASKWGLPFIHISTDAVFDGQSKGYEESDSTNPLSVYAQTKLAGEQAVQAAHSEALIARVVFYGWSLSGKRSLSEFFYNNLQAGQKIKGFTDTYFCPLYVEDLAEALLEMLAKGLTGIYHVVSPEHLSKYEFGLRIARRFGLDPDLIEPVSSADAERGVKRSLGLILNTEKVQNALERTLPSVDDGIDRLYERWQEGYHTQLQSFAG